MPSCFPWPAYKERWNILLLGDNEVGKTSFAYRFSDDVFGKQALHHLFKSCMKPWLQETFGKLVFSGDHVKECHFNEDDSCIVSLSDTWVSQISYTGIDDAIPFSHGIILMYSINSRWSFQDVSRTCRQIPLDTRQNPRLVLVLVGTKCDEKSTREVSAEEGMALAAGLGCKAFFETSAKSGENVDAAVFSMIQALRQADKDHSMNLMTPFKMLRNIPSLFQKAQS